jgi:hypothetical protein
VGSQIEAIMSSLLKPTTFWMALTFLALTSVLIAQQPKGVATAPLPAQIQNAKKVFIANAPGDLIASSGEGADGPYNQFYTLVKNWGQYELAASPAEADLVFEISFTNSLAGVGGTSTTGCSSSYNPQLRLVILDPKTQTPLWWLAEPIAEKRYMFHVGRSSYNFDDTVAKMVNDLKKLTATPASGAKG